MVSETALTLLQVVSTSPGRLRNRAGRKLMEALAHKLGTASPPDHLRAASAFSRNGSDPAPFLDLFSILKTIAIRPEGHQQARSQSWAGSAEASKQSGVLMLSEELGDVLVVAFDDRQQSQELLDQRNVSTTLRHFGE